MASPVFDSKNLVAWMDVHGVSQLALGRASGVAQSRLSAICTSGATPNLRTLRRISDGIRKLVPPDPLAVEQVAGWAPYAKPDKCADCPRATLKRCKHDGDALSAAEG